MNDNFESIVGACELSDNELMLIQGGSLWSAISHAASSVGHALSTAAKDVYKAVSSKTGQKVISTAGTVIGVIATIASFF